MLQIMHVALQMAFTVNIIRPMSVFQLHVLSHASHRPCYLQHNAPTDQHLEIHIPHAHMRLSFVKPTFSPTRMRILTAPVLSPDRLATTVRAHSTDTLSPSTDHH